MTRWLLSVLLSAALPVWPLPPSQYSSGELVGRVIDSETKAPIPGVNVVVQWPLEGGIEGHAFTLLHVDEAVTAEDGTFHLPGWGPLPRPSRAILGRSDPQYFFFTSGYLPLGVGNTTQINGRLPPRLPSTYSELDSEIRLSRWNGYTFELQPFQATGDEYSKRMLWRLGGETTFLFGKDCWWMKVPRFIRALDDEMNRKRTAERWTEQFKISALLRYKNCGPFDDFLKAVGRAKQ